MRKRGRPERDFSAKVYSEAISNLAETDEKWLRARLAIFPGREVSTLEGIDNVRQTYMGQLTGKRYRWRVLAVHAYHFTAAFISPRTKAHGIRHEFTWADVVSGKVLPC